VFGTVAGLGVGAVAIAALPALHNLYYGHQVAFLLRTPNLPINFPIPYAKALGSLTDPRLRPVLLRQLRGVTDVAPATSAEALVSARPIFDVAVHVIQAAWLLAVLGAIRVRHRISTTGKLLLALPLAFLLPHLFIQVYVYYPRHIVAGYLAMAVAAAWVIGDLAGSGEDLSGSDVG
jgi:hypothetical protein